MKILTYRDPLVLAIEISQQRNKALILWEMENKKRTKQDLITRISNLTSQQIQQELQELIEIGLVSRIIHVRHKPQVIEYALTNRGAMLLKCLRKMMNVGIEIMMDFEMNEQLLALGYIEKTQDSCEVISDKNGIPQANVEEKA